MAFVAAVLAGYASSAAAQAPPLVGLRVLVPGEAPLEVWTAVGAPPSIVKTADVVVAFQPGVTESGAVWVDIRTVRSVTGRPAAPVTRVHVSPGRASRTPHGWQIALIGTQRAPDPY